MQVNYFDMLSGLKLTVLAVAWLCRNANASRLYQGLKVNSFEPYGAGSFVPVGDLHALSANEFTSLSHPTFPDYVVRIKEAPGFCNDTVKYVR